MSSSRSLEEIKNEVSSILNGYFVEKPVDVINNGFRGIYIDLVVLRKVISPVIFRNNERTELTYTRFKNRVLVEVYSRKFKAPEKITGIKILKKFVEKIDNKDFIYVYNSLSDAYQLKNPVSVLYGDSVTAGGANQGAQIPSRVLYSWGLSPQEFECVAEERTHNALSEMGTMWDIKEGTFRQSLFKNIYMKRGHILQTVSLFNVSLNEVIFGIGNILFTHTYGAEDNVNIRNIKNEIVSIILSSPFESPITPYTIVEKIDRDCNSLLNDNELKKLINNAIDEYINNYNYIKKLDENKLGILLNYIEEIYTNEHLLKELIDEMVAQSVEFVNTLTK